jgi:hypothetical protein
MAVHVNEMHTDVRPADPPGHAGSSAPDGAPSGRTADEVWRESRARTEWLRLRTAAEGFDD